jgi:hypothetical protein
MLHFLDRCAWIMTSLGLALLVIGVVLVPDNFVHGQLEHDEVYLRRLCNSHQLCNVDCDRVFPFCYRGLCNAAPGCGWCNCRMILGTFCECTD